MAVKCHRLAAGMVILLAWGAVAQAAEPRLEILSVKPSKIVYDDAEPGRATVRLLNPLPESQEVTLHSTLCWDLDESRSLEPLTVTVPAQGEALAEVTWGAPAGKWGHEIRVEAQVNGEVADVGRQFFGVNSDWMDMVIVANLWDWAQGDMWPFISYTNLQHWFAWAPADYAENAPGYEEWGAGQGPWRQRKQDIVDSIRRAQEVGVRCTFYNNSFSNGVAGVEWARRHPEWVSRDRNGMPAVSGSAFVMAKRPWDEGTEAQGFVRIDFYDLECVKWGARNVLESIEMFGWDGMFWDCGGVYLFPGYSWDGEASPHGQDPDLISARNFRVFHEIIREEYPHFAFWINGSVEFYKLPFWSSFGNGGGLPTMRQQFSMPNSAMLAEFRFHEQPGSEFSNWRRCYEAYARERDAITQQFDGAPVIAGYTWGHDTTGEKGPKVAASRNYWVAGNHLMAVYLATQMHPAANPNFGLYAGTQFMCRYSGLLWGRDVKVIPEPQDVFSVEASRPVWWEKGVYRRPATDGELVMMHLVNVPETETVDIYRVPDPPAATATVRLALPDGRRLASVYALQMRGYVNSSNQGGAPVKFEQREGRWVHTTGAVSRFGPSQVELDAQMEGDQVVVEVPEFLFHTLLVFRLED